MEGSREWGKGSQVMASRTTIVAKKTNNNGGQHISLGGRRSRLDLGIGCSQISVRSGLLLFARCTHHSWSQLKVCHKLRPECRPASSCDRNFILIYNGSPESDDARETYKSHPCSRPEQAHVSAQIENVACKHTARSLPSTIGHMLTTELRNWDAHMS